ncbi:DUF3748 domain-containing protein [Spirosoma sp. HMF3257]|uniref:DUF3748 domain-containing protein n=1 Tax=Spirosoma telluris TaxID=2183553 RepID=A0A327NND5_9BACT|nr:DUF3748 domain-containing protein [Spirosoma telluris]RAI75354.1 DUF3748 domain-containing protein [Spirosoma telluris]
MKQLWIIALSLLNSCMTLNNSRTVLPTGHTLHHNGVFSKDGQWIVFDGRNDDTKIGETSIIGIVNVKTGEEKIIYKTANQTVYGPGVGAVSFSPVDDKVIFIHGLADANAEKPYAMSRRTGVGIDINNPYRSFFYDARDIRSPYTPGSLRGGTHSHCWSGDGQLISFTYNNELVDADLRAVGVMLPCRQGVKVDAAKGNNDGIMFSSIVTNVVRNPRPGSDEINKAFDECWVGKNGYRLNSGAHIPHAIAFQGNVLNKEGKQITEVFIVDIDSKKILADSAAVGKAGEGPRVPEGIHQRRITFSKKGLSTTRHWLRSSPDGKFIYALAKDQNEYNQLTQIEANTGEMRLLTNNNFSIDYSFNLNKEGNKIAYVAQNSVYLFDLLKGVSTKLTSNEKGKIVGAPSFSPVIIYWFSISILLTETGTIFYRFERLVCLNKTSLGHSITKQTG